MPLSAFLTRRLWRFKNDAILENSKRSSLKLGFRIKRALLSKKSHLQGSSKIRKPLQLGRPKDNSPLLLGVFKLGV